MGLRPAPGGVVNVLALAERIQRDHPDWSWSDCAQHAEDQIAEYEADEAASRLEADQ